MTGLNFSYFDLAGEGRFFGFYDPDVRWNGFYCPRFPLSTVKEIAKLTEKWAADEPEGFCRIVVKGKQVFLTGGPDDEHHEEPACGVSPSGEPLFAIGSFGWCWGLFENPFSASPFVDDDSRCDKWEHGIYFSGNVLRDGRLIPSCDWVMDAVSLTKKTAERMADEIWAAIHSDGREPVQSLDDLSPADFELIEELCVEAARDEGNLRDETTVSTLKKIEGELRALSVDMWVQTVDDPETATPESEEAGMTPERRQLRLFMDRVSKLADLVESTVNDRR